MYALIATKNVDLYWDALAPWIGEAVGVPDPAADLEVIKSKALSGVAQIWVGKSPKTGVIDIVLVTEGMVLDNIPTLVIRWLTAVDLNDCMIDFALIENWAHTQGFQRLQVWGRRGWERKLRPLGFVHNFTVLDKFISQGLH